tara:strand:- start:466 stop:3657 length:3192 start_codon:yes stop_codon:yes gene_type:complete
MAAGEKFSTTYYSCNGWEYELVIYDKIDGGGTPLDFTMGEAPVLSYDSSGDDKLSPLMCSTLTFGFMVENITQSAWFTNIRSSAYAERDIYATLVKTTSQEVWSGYLILDRGNKEDVSMPYEIKMKFIDGLALLKDIDFVPDASSTNAPYSYSDTFLDHAHTTGYGYKNIVWWLAQILSNAGIADSTVGANDWRIATANNWYNEAHGDDAAWATKDPLYLTAINAMQFYKSVSDDDVTTQAALYEAVNCYDALVAICSTFGLRCIYYHSQVFFIQVGLYNTAESGTTANPINIDPTFTYTSAGAAVSSDDKLGGTNISRYELDIEDSADLGLQKLAGANWGEYPPVKKATASFPSISNHNFFQAFPLIYGQSTFDSTGTGAWVAVGDANIVETSTVLGTFTDAHNIQGWYMQVYLAFTKTIGGASAMKVRWTIRARPTAQTTWNTATALVLVNEYNTSTSAWELYWEPYKALADQSAAALSFWDNSGGTTGTLGGTVSNEAGSCDIGYMTPAGTTTEEIISQSRIGTDYNHIIPPHPSMTGDWDFEIYTLTSATSVGPLVFANGNGVRFNGSLGNCSPWAGIAGNIWTGNNMYYSNVISPTSLSMFSALAGGSINQANSNVSFQTNTTDSYILELKNTLWGDTLTTNVPGSLLVYNGTAWEFTDFLGKWGRGIVTGTDSLTELLCREAINLHPDYTSKYNMTLATSATNTNLDGNANYPKFVNPIGRIMDGTTAYVFSRGKFNTAQDEWSGMWWEMDYNSQTGTVVVWDDNHGNGGLNPGFAGGGTTGGVQYNMSQPNTTAAAAYNSKVVSFSTLTTTLLYNVAVTSLAIYESTAVMKVGDIIRIRTNLDVDGKNYSTLTVAGDVSVGDTSITIQSFTPDQDYFAGAEITLDQDNLFEQYQRKTEGTIAGMAVSADTLGPIYYKGGVYNITGVDPTYVKILPRDFMINDDGSDEALNFKDSSNSGVQVGTAAQEMLATVNIPYGTIATEVYIWGSNTTKTVEVYECGVDTNGIGSTIGTGTTNGSAISITDTAATSTNYLLILVKVNAASQRIYGGQVTLTQN